jgi:hypothetical protein
MCVFTRLFDVQTRNSRHCRGRADHARKGLFMAMTDISPPGLDSAVRGRLGLEAYIIIIGVAAVVVFGICRFVYEPSYQAKQQGIQTALTAEHMKVCGQLGKTAASDRDNCLKLLDTLYMTHERAILADSSEI